MSMHLLGPEMCTTQYSRKKNKKPMNVAKLEHIKVQWRQHNNKSRKKKLHAEQFEQIAVYDADVSGTYKAPKRDYKPAPYQPPQLNREAPDYPSLSNNIGGSTAKKESMKYTGERKLVGIATMHKSNMVPIFEDNKEEAIEIARMRR